MQFCEGCDNVLSLRRALGESQLEWYCLSCAYSKPVHDGSAVTIRMTRKQSGNEAVNPLMVHDPRLPRSRDIPCPNEDCVDPPLCVSVRTDHACLTFTHICVHCMRVWESAPAERQIGDEKPEDENEDEKKDDDAMDEVPVEADEEDLAFWEDTIGVGK